MISYPAVCICCKKDFQLVEGTNKYRLYKKNKDGKFTCDDCDERIEREARSGLAGKLK